MCRIARSRRLLLLLLPFAILLGCGASVDPAMQASIDKQVSALQQQSTTYPRPAAEMPPPLSPSQWVRVKSVDSDGRPSFITSKIVGQAGSATWVETVLESYAGRSIVKMLVDFGDRTDPEKIDIQGLIVKLKDHAPVDYSQNPMLGIVKGTYKGIVKNFVIRWHGLPQETRTTFAGTFSDCFKGTSEVSFGPITRSGIAWYHPSVPINGAVAFHGDRGDTQELVAFGMTGAVSEL